MKPNIFLLLLLFLTFNTSQSVLPALAIAHTVVSIGLTIYDSYNLKKENENSELATKTLLALSQAFETHEVAVDNRLNDLHSTVKLQFFQETVSFPAHNLYITADKYLKSQSDFMEQMLVNECFKHTPYTRLISLNTLISQHWFLTQAEHENYRLPDVETLRIRIFHALNELVFSHFICMAVQGEPVEGSVLTDIVLSTISNITDTIDKELKIIEDTFFPKYVVKEVYNLISDADLPEDEIKRMQWIAESTLDMLKTTYGKGIIVDSENRIHFDKDYEVQVTKYSTFGQMPAHAIVDIKFKDYYILITRANEFGVNMDLLNLDVLISELFEPFTLCTPKSSSSLPKVLSAPYDIFALTLYTSDDNIIIARRPKPIEIRGFTCGCYLFCTETRLVITSANLDSSAAAITISQPSESSASNLEQQLQTIQKLRIEVQAELRSVEQQKLTSSSGISKLTVSAVFAIIGLSFTL